MGEGFLPHFLLTMKFYFHKNRDLTPVWSLAIDPGQKTLGFSLLNLESGDHIIGGLETFCSPLKMTMAELAVLSDSKSRIVQSKIPFSSDRVRLVIEQTTTSFVFSSGIVSSIQSLFSILGPVETYFVSPKIPNFFAGVKKVSQSMSKKIVLQEFPELKSILPKTVDKYAHICDAICMNIASNFHVWPNHSFSLRDPSVSLTQVNLNQIVETI